LSSTAGRITITTGCRRSPPNWSLAAIVAPNTSSALAAKAATQTIPIVFRIGSDPVALGLVASLNRPTGNLTGLAALNGDIVTKRLAVLHELVPAIASIALLVNPANPSYVQAETKDLQSAARVLGVRVLVLNGGTESEIATAFATIVEQQVGALLTSGDGFFNTAGHQIMSLAARYAIPTMFYNRSSVAAGGLLSYGTDITIGRNSTHIDGTLVPVEEPSTASGAELTDENVAASNGQAFDSIRKMMFSIFEITSISCCCIYIQFSARPPGTYVRVRCV
jgi:ABC-type uncharacterized transport system substrate-binding protein